MADRRSTVRINAERRDFLKNTLKVLHGLKITLAEKHTCDPSNTLDPENRTNRPETERVLPVLLSGSTLSIR